MPLMCNPLYCGTVLCLKHTLPITELGRWVRKALALPDHAFTPRTQLFLFKINLDEQRKLTRAGLEPATSGLTCRGSTN